MRGSRPKWSFLALFLLPLLAACIELEGQRITIDYDAQRDHLTLLICYDGVHDHAEDDLTKSIADLREFIAADNIMILDWFGKIEWSKIYLAIDDPDVPEAARDLARAVKRDITVTTLGHYRDPRGHIGAAQRVDIVNASKFLVLANEALNQAILADAEEGGELEPLHASAVEAARAGWTWASLDGRALVGSFPLPKGWSTAAGLAVRSAIEAWAKQLSKFEDGDSDSPHIFTNALATLSIDQQPRQVTVRLGFREEPNTVRFGLRRGYKDNLAADVIAAVPAELDRLIADQILQGGANFEAPLGGGLGAIPTEDRVRAMLWARSGDHRDAAEAWLDQFRDRWNAEGRIPEAPNSGPDDPAWADCWAAWYATVACSVE